MKKKTTWQPGEVLSAEKLNSLLQFCKIKTVDIVGTLDDNDNIVGYILNRTAGDIINVLNNNKFFIVKYRSTANQTRYMFFIAQVIQSQQGYNFSITTCSGCSQITFSASNLTDFPATNQIIDVVLDLSK